jgi:2-polyprenyl-6-methoxyphenol hydroxylase-like FAD-dependent oxidoreductase
VPEVLVVGAGPVGLTMAAELARHGVTCRIVDQLASPLPYCRAIGVTPRTLEVWEDMGVVREMLDAGIELKGFRLEIGDKPPQDMSRDLSDLPFAQLGLPQPETERILTRHLRGLGVDVERGVRVTGAQAQGDDVAVTLDRDGKTEEVVFRYVIGCDGAHSVIRRAAGIGFPGEPMPYDFMLGDVHVDLGLPHGLGLRLIRPKPNAPPDILVAVPLPEWNRYRITLFAPQELSAGGGSDHGIQSERATPSLMQLQTEFDRVAPGRGTLSDMRWSSMFRISTRLADHYRAGNIFLAGDAAHIHPPTGGQGMNTGIQDAYNLAWKMALVLKGAARPGLLDSYEPERRTEGLSVLARTTAATQGIAQRGADDRLADTQILVAYAASTWIRDDAGDALPMVPAPGQRAPDCRGLRRAGVGFPLRLFEVLRGTEHVLLVDATPEKLTALREFAAQVRVVAIGTKPADTEPGVTWLADAGGDFRDVYISRAGAAWLIRPDGYIAWRGAGDFSAKLADYLRVIFHAHAFDPGPERAT